MVESPETINKERSLQTWYSKWLGSSFSDKSLENKPELSQVLDDLKKSCNDLKKEKCLEALKCWRLWIGNESSDGFRPYITCCMAVRPISYKKCQSFLWDNDVVMARLDLFSVLLMKVRDFMHLEGPQYILETFLQSCFSWLFCPHVLSDEVHFKILELLLMILQKSDGSNRYETYQELRMDLFRSRKLFARFADTVLDIFLIGKESKHKKQWLQVWIHFLDRCSLSTKEIPLPVWHRIFKLVGRISTDSGPFMDCISFLHKCTTVLKSVLKFSKLIDCNNVSVLPSHSLLKQLVELCLSCEENEQIGLEGFKYCKDSCFLLCEAVAALPNYDYMSTVTSNIVNVLNPVLHWALWCGLTLGFTNRVKGKTHKHYSNAEMKIYRMLRGIAVNFDLDVACLPYEAIADVDATIRTLETHCTCLLCPRHRTKKDEPPECSVEKDSKLASGYEIPPLFYNERIKEVDLHAPEMTLSTSSVIFKISYQESGEDVIVLNVDKSSHEDKREEIPTTVENNDDVDQVSDAAEVNSSATPAILPCVLVEEPQTDVVTILDEPVENLIENNVPNEESETVAIIPACPNKESETIASVPACEKETETNIETCANEVICFEEKNEKIKENRQSINEVTPKRSRRPRMNLEIDMKNAKTASRRRTPKINTQLNDYVVEGIAIEKVISPNKSCGYDQADKNSKEDSAEKVISVTQTESPHQSSSSKKKNMRQMNLKKMFLDKANKTSVKVSSNVNEEKIFPEPTQKVIVEKINKLGIDESSEINKNLPMVLLNRLPASAAGDRDVVKKETDVTQTDLYKKKFAELHETYDNFKVSRDLSELHRKYFELQDLCTSKVTNEKVDGGEMKTEVEDMEVESGRVEKTEEQDTCREQRPRREKKPVANQTERETRKRKSLNLVNDEVSETSPELTNQDTPVRTRSMKKLAEDVPESRKRKVKCSPEISRLRKRTLKGEEKVTEGIRRSENGKGKENRLKVRKGSPKTLDIFRSMKSKPTRKLCQKKLSARKHKSLDKVLKRGVVKNSVTIKTEKADEGEEDDLKLSKINETEESGEARKRKKKHSTRQKKVKLEKVEIKTEQVSPVQIAPVVDENVSNDKDKNANEAEAEIICPDKAAKTVIVNSNDVLKGNDIGFKELEHDHQYAKSPVSSETNEGRTVRSPAVEVINLPCAMDCEVISTKDQDAPVGMDEVQQEIIISRDTVINNKTDEVLTKDVTTDQDEEVSGDDYKLLEERKKKRIRIMDSMRPSKRILLDTGVEYANQVKDEKEKIEIEEKESPVSKLPAEADFEVENREPKEDASGSRISKVCSSPKSSRKSDTSPNGLRSRAMQMLALLTESPKLKQITDFLPGKVANVKRSPNVDVKGSRASKMLALLPENKTETEIPQGPPSTSDENEDTPTDCSKIDSVNVTPRPLGKEPGPSVLKSAKTNTTPQRKTLRFDDDRNETMEYYTDTPPSITGTDYARMKQRRIESK